MNLPKPPPSYDQGDEAQARAAIETADGQNVKRNSVFDKILIRDTATGKIVTVTMASGAFVITVP